MNLFMITYDEAEFPKHYVIREWRLSIPPELVKEKAERVFKTLDDARRWIPANRVQLTPMKGDDPVIVETWV